MTMKKKQKKFDDAFKLLATRDAEALLLLIGELTPGEKAEIIPLERELRLSTTQADQAYRVISERGERIVHIEAESWWKNVMPKRMADYGAREWMLYGLPVDCYVLLLTDRGLPAKPSTIGRIDAGDIQITVRFRIIRLSQIRASQILGLQREYLLPFVPLMEATQNDLAEGAELIRDVEDENLRGELGFYFGAFSGVKYNLADLLEVVWRNRMDLMELIEESSFYHYVVEQVRNKVAAEVRNEVVEEVQIEMARNMLSQLIARRFPKVRVAKKLAQLNDVNMLQKLCLEFDEIQDEASLRKRLDKALKSQKAK